MKRSEYKKKLERYHLKQFSDLMIDFPKGDIIDFENPDFFIELENYKIGFEVTRIYKSSKRNKPLLQAIESTIDRICNKTQESLYEHEIPYLQVTLSFKPFQSLIKLNRDEMSKKLCNIILKNIPKEKILIFIKKDYENSEFFPNEISLISIARFDNFTMHSVLAIKGGSDTGNYIEDIQKILNKKEEKLKKSKCNCDEYWLIIVARGFSGATLFTLSEETKNYEYKTSFYRIFFLELFHRKLIELKIKKLSL